MDLNADLGGIEEEADFPLIIDIDRANAFMLPGTRYFRVLYGYPGTEVEVPGTVCGTAVWSTLSYEPRRLMPTSSTQPT